LIPKTLSATVTVDFSDTSLHQIAEWIQKNRKITVLFDDAALAKDGIPQSELVTDHLQEQPVYFLLNRLRSLGLAWYIEDEILHITTTRVVAARMSTRPYNIGDLLDAGYQRDDLDQTITAGTPGPWETIDGEGGTMKWLGDVLFVRQTDDMHRQVEGLMIALRKHGRQTFTFDPPQHGILRKKLEQKVSVRIDSTPLAKAVQELSRQTGADIRLDVPALRAVGVRDREPVSLTLPDRTLKTVLNVLLADLKLTWILRDGVLWITSTKQAADFQKTAVYDVRDLCRNGDEANALTEAIQTQTTGPWADVDGDGGAIAFPRTGTMMVRHAERGLREVADLLATYRKALTVSKRRKRDVVDPQEVITRYYRMDEKIAADLEQRLPQLVQPETWKTGQRPKAPGTILKVASQPEFLDTRGQRIQAVATAGKTVQVQALLPRAVLIVRQTRAVHKEIAKIIHRIEQGDAPETDNGGLGGGGFGGGGFGGGYFSID